MYVCKIAESRYDSGCLSSLLETGSDRVLVFREDDMMAKKSRTHTSLYDLGSVGVTQLNGDWPESVFTLSMTWNNSFIHQKAGKVLRNAKTILHIVLYFSIIKYFIK